MDFLKTKLAIKSLQISDTYYCDVLMLCRKFELLPINNFRAMSIIIIFFVIHCITTMIQYIHVHVHV